MLQSLQASILGDMLLLALCADSHDSRQDEMSGVAAPGDDMDQEAGDVNVCRLAGCSLIA